MSPTEPRPKSAARPPAEESMQETYIPGNAPGGDALDKTVVGGDDGASPRPAATSSSSAGDGQQSGARKISQLGDFKLVKKLGQGGMGEVFLATQISLDRKVALKTLSKELAKKPDFVARFLREAKSMARLQHANIVQVYAADSAHGLNYVAIEFIDGASMQKYMDQQKRLSVGDALHVTLVCCDALRHAHELNMIHRDIKPDNILVTSKGVVKVADFGLAKAMDEDVSMTQSGTGLGTPLYMAPEQARNAKHVDQRTDIYAVGCMLYYFLTGKLPFTGNNTLELILAKEGGRFTSARKLNPEIPERLDLMIDKMMAKDPNSRYSSCAEIIKDLSELGLANPALSFIDGAVSSSAVAAPSAASMSHAGSTRKLPTLPTSSAADAARQNAATDRNDPRKEWFVKFTNKAGQSVASKLTTEQLQKGIRGGTIDIKAKAKTHVKGEYLPLAQYSEFASLMEARIIKEKADAKSGNMKDVYAKLDKQDQRRKRWRWLKNLFDGTKGLVGLVIWLGLIAGALFAAWKFGWPYVQEMIAKSKGG